jgi:hypothetical protein
VYICEIDICAESDGLSLPSSSYWIALASTLFGLIVLLPVHVHGGNGMPRLEKLSLANVAVRVQRKGLVEDGSVIVQRIGWSIGCLSFSRVSPN